VDLFRRARASGGPASTAAAHAIRIAIAPNRADLIGAPPPGIFDSSKFELPRSVKVLVKVAIDDTTARPGTVTGIMANGNFPLAAGFPALLNSHDEAAVLWSAMFIVHINVSDADFPAAVVQPPCAHRRYQIWNANGVTKQTPFLSALTIPLVPMVGHPMGATGADNLAPHVVAFVLNETFLRIDITAYASVGVIYPGFTFRTVILPQVRRDGLPARMFNAF
jgi:hypothetical protein